MATEVTHTTASPQPIPAWVAAHKSSQKHNPQAGSQAALSFPGASSLSLLQPS